MHEGRCTKRISNQIQSKVIAMMLYDYDVEKHIKSEKAYEYERRMEYGMERGMKSGIEQGPMNITEATAKNRIICAKAVIFLYS